MKRITITDTTITGLYSEEAAPDDSIQITEDQYQIIRNSKYGFGEFRWIDNQLVNIEISPSQQSCKINKNTDLFLEAHNAKETLRTLLLMLDRCNYINIDELPPRLSTYLNLPVMLLSEEDSITSQGLAKDKTFIGLGNDSI